MLIWTELKLGFQDKDHPMCFCPTTRYPSCSRIGLILHHLSTRFVWRGSWDWWIKVSFLVRTRLCQRDRCWLGSCQWKRASDRVDPWPIWMIDKTTRRSCSFILGHRETLFTMPEHLLYGDLKIHKSESAPFCFLLLIPLALSLFTTCSLLVPVLCRSWQNALYYLRRSWLGRYHSSCTCTCTCIWSGQEINLLCASCAQCQLRPQWYRGPAKGLCKASPHSHQGDARSFFKWAAGQTPRWIRHCCSFWRCRGM